MQRRTTLPLLSRVLCIGGALSVWSSAATAQVQPATPSFSGTSASVILTHSFGTFWQGAAGATFDFPVFNLPASMGTTSPMSLDHTDSNGDTASIMLTGNVSGLAAPGQMQMHLVLSTSQVGNLAVTHTPYFRSDALPGSPLKSLAISAYATVLRRGDYDGDGDVDNADYTRWRTNYVTNNSAIDGNENGVVDAADYVLWRRNFPSPGSGDSTGAGAGHSNLGTVPEPTSLAVITMGLAFTTLLRGRAWLATRRRRSTPFR